MTTFAKQDRDQFPSASFRELTRLLRPHFDAANDLREEFGRIRDTASWVERNRWIFGAPWRYDSAGPKMDVGKKDAIPDRMLRPYLARYVADRAEEKSMIKCRQSEMTENNVNELLYLCLTRPYTQVEHVFPTGELGDALSKEKIGPAISGSPRIVARVLESAVRSYRFRNGSGYSVVGSMSQVAGRGGSKDAIVFDEYDSMSSSVEEIFAQELSHSALRLVRRISTPTSPGVGIDRAVREGCEWIWHFDCPKCRKGQSWEWPESVINYFEIGGEDRDSPEYERKLNGVHFGCRFCGAYVDRNSEGYVASGRWEAVRPWLAETKSSYRINAAMVPWKTGKSVLRVHHRLAGYASTFRNEEWGDAHVRGESALSEADVLRCCRDWPQASRRTHSMGRVCVGIDQGERESWIVVRTRGYDGRRPETPCIVAVIVVDDALLKRMGLSDHPSAHAECERLIVARFDATTVVMDANGIGADRFRYLLKHYPQKGRIWGAFFDAAESGRQIRQSQWLKPNFQTARSRLTFSKVNALKEVQREIRREEIGLPSPTGRGAREARLLISHLQALAVLPAWDARMEREYEKVVRLREQDHLADSAMYALMAELHAVGYSAHVPGVI